MYFVTGPANADIDKYMQWQREQWGVNVATRWFNNLYARFDSLAAMPGQAAECEWAPGLRMAHEDKYCIYYELFPRLR